MYALDLHQNIVLQRDKDNRAYFCSKLTADLLPDVVFHVHSVLHPENELENQKMMLDNIFKHMKATFADSLNHSEWLDDKSRSQLLQKADSILLSFRSNNISGEEVALKEKYINFALKSNEYGQNLDKAMIINRRSFYALHGTTFSAEQV